MSASVKQHLQPVEVQQRHPARSHGVRCCNQTLRWSTDAKFVIHESGNTLRMTCKKCKTCHWKETTKDMSPIE